MERMSGFERSSRIGRICCGAVAALLPVAAVMAQPTMTYTDSGNGKITKPFNKDGGILKTTPGYKISGNGTATISIKDPGNNPVTDKLVAVAGLDGFTAVFYGSTAAGQATWDGTYRVVGAPDAGAAGSLSGNAVYLQYIGAAGVGKITGSGKSTVTSDFKIDPFGNSAPGPNPSTVETGGGVGTSSAGSTDYQTALINGAAVVKNGLYAVSLKLNVSASRTGGAVTSFATWKEFNPTWTLTVAAAGAALDLNQAEEAVASAPPPTPLIGQLTLAASALKPENLEFDGGGNLIYSSMDPASVNDTVAYAMEGPSFKIGNLTGLEYTSGLKRDGANMFALRSFSYGSANFDVADSALLQVDPVMGTASPVPLSQPLKAPGGLAVGRGGFAGAKLVTELGLGGGAQPALLQIDAGGNVSTLFADLGAENPANLTQAPGGFGPYTDDLFVLHVGSSTGGVMQNGTGSIQRIDDLTLSKSSFLSGLVNPISMAFADGTLAGQPGTTMLYVLAIGDLDPLTGLPLGNGTLVAYSEAGLGTPIVTGITTPSSLLASLDGLELFFASGNAIYRLTIPEPATALLVALAAAGVRRRRTAR